MLTALHILWKTADLIDYTIYTIDYTYEWYDQILHHN